MTHLRDAIFFSFNNVISWRLGVLHNERADFITRSPHILQNMTKHALTVMPS